MKNIQTEKVQKASLRRGFYFALLQCSHIQAFTTRFAPSMQLYHPRHKTAHRALQGCILIYVPFYSRKYQTNTRGYNTACALIWIHARQCSISQTMQARRGQPLPSANRWQVMHTAHLLRRQRLHLYRVSPAACDLAPVSGQGAPGLSGTIHPAGLSTVARPEPLAALAAALFRAFAR